MESRFGGQWFDRRGLHRESSAERTWNAERTQIGQAAGAGQIAAL
jgi:hypothetical protein